MAKLPMLILMLHASTLIQVSAGGWMDKVNGAMTDMKADAESAGSHMLSKAVNESKQAAGVISNKTTAAINQTKAVAMSSLNQTLLNRSKLVAVAMNKTTAVINETKAVAMSSWNQTLNRTEQAAMRWIGAEQKAACLSTVKQSLEDANVTLHKQLFDDCASSAALVPFAAEHFNDTCKSLGELYIQHTMSEQNSSSLLSCYKSANTTLDWRAALTQWSRDSKAKMYKRFDGVTSKAIDKAKARLSTESKFALVGHIMKGDANPWLVVAASCAAMSMSFIVLAFTIGRRSTLQRYTVDDAAPLIEADLESVE